MQLNLFSKTARLGRVTKLTDKAKAAIEEKIETSKKRKNAPSAANAVPKKAKPTQPNGHAKDRSLNAEDFAEASPPPATTGMSHSAVVRTEEEEAELFADAELVDDESETESSVPLEPSSDVENAEDELSKTNQFN
jgi:hypothetical protein